jgi:penicillin-binding protein 1C
VPDGRDAVDTLRIEGIADRATLAPPPGSTRGLSLRVRALGSAVPVQWLLDGRAIARTEGARAFEHDYAGSGRGEHVLTALADSGAWAQVRFRVADIGGAVRAVPADTAGAGD